MRYVKINSEIDTVFYIVSSKNDGKQTEVSASDDSFEVITV